MVGLKFVPLPLDLVEPGAVRMLVNVDDKCQQQLCFVNQNRFYWEPAQYRVGAPDLKFGAD